jgi:hypothetical protein
MTLTVKRTPKTSNGYIINQRVQELWESVAALHVCATALAQRWHVWTFAAPTACAEAVQRVQCSQCMSSALLCAALGSEGCVAGGRRHQVHQLAATFIAHRCDARPSEMQ